MKKLLLAVVALFAYGFANAQVEKGKILLEANTGFGGNNVGSTGFYLDSQDGSTSYNVGVEGGYFVMENLAVKLGLGYGGFSPKDGDATNSIGYKVGAKYYVIGKIPVELSVNGGSTKDADENPLWLGVQAGYAVFLADNIALEPGIRYNHSLNEDYTDKGVIQFNVGFSLFF